jgi:hypothetical protein
MSPAEGAYLPSEETNRSILSFAFSRETGADHISLTQRNTSSFQAAVFLPL